MRQTKLLSKLDLKVEYGSSNFGDPFLFVIRVTINTIVLHCRTVMIAVWFVSLVNLVSQNTYSSEEK